LRFLGETAPDVLDRVRRSAEECGSAWRSFDLLVQGLGCFPDDRRPRVIWAGAADESGSLARISEDLERVARTAGFPPEQRPFSAHLTLGGSRVIFAGRGEWLADLVRRRFRCVRDRFCSGGELLKVISVHRPGLLRLATIALME
jgi:2'-5' RNA ligase